MDRNHFLQRLDLAGKLTRDLALQFIIEELPEELRYTLWGYNNPDGRAGPPETIKFLGGRFLRPEDLKCVPAKRAAALLWVDGRIPAWINLYVRSRSEFTTELHVLFSTYLVPADENDLTPDVGWPKGNAIAPFRIRGPHTPYDWRSIELDGRFPLSWPGSDEP